MSNALDGFEYSAFEHWNYHQLIYFPEGQEKTWLSISQSFYRASNHLVDGVVNSTLREDIEGRAALFLLRHYLDQAREEIRDWLHELRSEADY